MSKTIRFYRGNSIEIFFAMFAVLVLVTIMVLAIGFVITDPNTQHELQNTNQMLQVESGEWFNCDFFDNGDMICEQVGDPDVGGGRVQP